ncbi:uncharacterized protein LOC123472617 [Daphnia magna]|uniref:uncharacterized protein LOC123472617 n=1 Tax=Daphnia magna TaxID=35525 RepID=UPI001E1BA768|nr:uncharacterized protein LOC123472617 [Daphnia magna]
MTARMSSSPKSSRFKMEVSVDDQFIPDILLLGGVFGRRIKCLNLQTHERANFHRKKANAIISKWIKEGLNRNTFHDIQQSNAAILIEKYNLKQQTESSELHVNHAECLSSNSAPHTEVEECLPQDFQPVPIGMVY